MSSRRGVSSCSLKRQAPRSSSPNRAAIARRNRRASPPSPFHARSQARRSSSRSIVVQFISCSAIWPAASMTNASSAPALMPLTRPSLPWLWWMLAELNRTPTASAATAWPASCQAVRTVAFLAGERPGKQPQS